MNMVIEVFAAIYAAFLLFQAIRWFWLIHHFPELDPGISIPDRTSWPSLSIIIPARNEEPHVEPCLRSLLSQQYPGAETIVVDDESTDETFKIAQRFEKDIVLIRTPTLPRGWVGKSWACHNGALRAKGDWLLFTDADAIHCNSGLKAAIAEAIREKADMLTVWPLMIMKGFWERLILPIVFRYFFVDFKGRFVNSPSCRTSAGFGMFMLIRRDVYWAIGGHKAISQYTDEDYRLAENVKAKRFLLCVIRGHRILEKRMYEDLSTMWEGWVKNSFAGFDYSLPLCLVGMLRLGMTSVMPFFITVSAAIFLFLEPTLSPIGLGLCLSLYPIVLMREITIRMEMGYARWPALLTFLGEALFICMNLHSAILTLIGTGVTWKGRAYSEKPKP